MKQVVVFVSSPEAALVHEAINVAGEGRVGNYTAKINKAISSAAGKLRALDEEKIEFACDDDTYARILSAIGAVAPYSAVDSWNMETYMA